MYHDMQVKFFHVCADLVDNMVGDVGVVYHITKLAFDHDPDNFEETAYDCLVKHEQRGILRKPVQNATPLYVRVCMLPMDKDDAHYMMRKYWDKYFGLKSRQY